MSADYDVVVLGGGIQGTGVAQAVAAAGYKVLLLEQQGIAAATSSRSSKLIHGGLRYLESGQVSLVRKALAERKLLLHLAPDLVKRTAFYFPVYKETSRRPWKIRAGLGLYSLLGHLHADTRFQKLNKSHWARLDGLNLKGLQAVFQYWDAQTDDIALTRAVMMSALKLGAELRCPAEFVCATRRDAYYEVTYLQHDIESTLTTKTIVNATGPWVNEILSRIRPQQKGIAIDLVQGTHIVLDNPSPAGVYYVEVPQDKRVVLVMPWQGRMLVGTTELHYRGDPSKVRPSAEESQYLQSVFKHYFPGLNDTVVDSYAGLRVLPTLARTLFNRSRDTIIDVSLPGLVTLYGGKLTGYRATAADVLKQLKVFLPPQTAIADTRQLLLMPVTENMCG